MDDTLLEAMLADVPKAPELFKPTQFWAQGMMPILRDLKQQGYHNFRRQRGALDMFVPIYGSVDYYLDRAAMDGLIDDFGKKMPELAELWRDRINGHEQARRDYELVIAADLDRAPAFDRMFESVVGEPVEQFVFDGRTYSCAMLRYLKCLAFLKKKVDTEPIRNVLEIGGGYGSLGEIFMRSPSRDYFYVNVDIPPTAAVSTYYLQAAFGRSKVANYLQTRDLAPIRVEQLRANGFRAAVICPWQLPALVGDFELFVNATSFQEMEPEVVKNYATEVTRLTSHTILLKNSRYGKVTAETDTAVGVRKRTTREHYLSYFNQYAVKAIESAVFGQVYDNGFESEVIIFERKP
ncbi:putative sugar O-methyltransferase [Acanthopleuribacter pedis]|uniref:Putative sugar O-methyltransferase n=1 Tax=Acanthopleuribacter pedis TaxID=442870 RepID=A0A8J7QCR0_9BACT|nr:putative sugar O-methyltransferase [Acanthopleuribacter pedis]MBO1321364.1 putative sugar O-methyltransferase [Acanthopleuribacter pedis]